MVEHYVDHNFNVSIMGSVEKIFEVLYITKMLINFSEIFSPVAMVSILLRIRVHHLIDIVNDWADPNRIDTKLLQIIQLGCNTGKVSAMIGFWIVFIISCAIVGAVPVEETVSK
ncbi:hypothetical protein D3C81_1722140 [compost metagenome]